MPVSADILSMAIGQNPTGLVKGYMESHRLKWLVQMASRGNVRNSDRFGNCGEMKLFTTMDRNLLLENFKGLFPKSQLPKLVFGKHTVRKTKPAQLNHYLHETQSELVCASKIAGDLGWETKEVSKAFKSSTCNGLRYSGWALVAGNGRAAKPHLKYSRPDLSHLNEMLRCQ